MWVNIDYWAQGILKSNKMLDIWDLSLFHFKCHTKSNETLISHSRPGCRCHFLLQNNRSISRAKYCWDTHQKSAIICAFSLVFNEIALNPIDSSLPLFSVEYVRLSDRFCCRNNVEMGGRGKRKQRCPRPKILFNKQCLDSFCTGL